MDYYAIISILIVLSAVFGYVNVRFLKLPTTIGLMTITLLFTISVLIIGQFNDAILIRERALVSAIDFETVLMDIMLSFLLFAGALHTNFDQLKIHRGPVLMFSTLGVIVSTILVGGVVYGILSLLSLNVSLVYCFLFGALISPTDPIAVLGILKKANAPKKLEAKIVGESLFNDGVGVVVFLTLLSIAKSSGADVEPVSILKLFTQEVFGGIGLGLILGCIAFKMMKSIDNYEIEVIITIAIVMGGTLIAHKWHLSSPLAMVTAGLLVGNDKLRQAAMSKETEGYVDKFWELIDVLFNIILFVLIGMEILVLTFRLDYILAGLIAVPFILLCRYLSLWLPIKTFAKRLNFVPHTNLIMTWGGLRGGISVALALSLPKDMYRELFLVMTYVVVVFSIIGQGLTVGPIIKKLTEPKQ